MILNNFNESVIDYSIEIETNIIANKYKYNNIKENKNIIKKENLKISSESIEQIINKYNQIFDKFIEYKDITILYEEGTIILKKIIVIMIIITIDIKDKQGKERKVDKMKTIFEGDKSIKFERFIEEYYSNIFNEQIYEILKLQIIILNKLSYEGVTDTNFKQYVQTYIKVSLKSKMLELLIPIYDILKRTGKQEILLTEYYKNNSNNHNGTEEANNDVITMVTSTLPSSSLPSSSSLTSITIEDLIIPQPWYKRVYNWILDTLQNIRSFIIKQQAI